MTRTDIDSPTIARSLRRMAGDGSIEWVCEPIHASVLLDIADKLDENAKLRERIDDLKGGMLDEAVDYIHGLECTYVMVRLLGGKTSDEMLEMLGRGRINKAPTLLMSLARTSRVLTDAEELLAAVMDIMEAVGDELL